MSSNSVKMDQLVTHLNKQNRWKIAAGKKLQILQRCLPSSKLCPTDESLGSTVLTNQLNNCFLI